MNLQEALNRSDSDAIVECARAGEGGPDDWQTLTCVIRSDAELARAMVERGVGLNCPAQTPPGTFGAPLIEAVRKNDRALVELLLEKGASPRVRSGVLTPLASALATQRAEIAAILLARGAEPSPEEFQSEGWLSELGGAAGKSLGVLAPHISDPNVPLHAGWRLLHVAALHGDADSAKVLLERGAEPHPRTTAAWKNVTGKFKSGMTPLDIATGLVKKGDAGAAAVEQLLAAHSAPSKKPAAKKAKVSDVPVLVVPRGSHVHPSARLLQRPAKKGLYCAYCTTADPYHVVGSAEIFERREDARAYALLSSDYDDQLRGISFDTAKSLSRMNSVLTKKTESLAPGTIWEEGSLVGKSEPAQLAADAVKPGEVLDENLARIEAELFGAMLDRSASGSDELDVLLEASDSDDLTRLLAVSRLATLRTRPPMPAWYWNPRVPVPEEILQKKDAMDSFDKPVAFWSADRARASVRVLSKLLRSSHLKVALETAYKSLPRITTAPHPVLEALGDAEREQLRDALIALFERLLDKPVDNALAGHAGTVLAATLVRAPSPRFDALREKMKQGAWAECAAQLEKYREESAQQAATQTS